jgi:hypothetical protein
MKLFLALFLTWTALQGGQLHWRTGTVTRVTSGRQYLGTYSTSTSSPGRQQSLSIPIFRSDQVYVTEVMSRHPALSVTFHDAADLLLARLPLSAASLTRSIRVPHTLTIHRGHFTATVASFHR